MTIYLVLLLGHWVDHVKRTAAFKVLSVALYNTQEQTAQSMTP